MLNDWFPIDSQALTVHRLLVAIWSAAAIYVPPLCLLLTCYEITAVLLNSPVMMSNREIQWIVALFRPLGRWMSVEQPEVNPMEVKKIIEEVVEARKTEVDNRGDWDEEEAREEESEC